jgi:hypothetical protein
VFWRSAALAVSKYFACIHTAVPEICASDPAAVSKYFRVFAPAIFSSAANEIPMAGQERFRKS